MRTLNRLREEQGIVELLVAGGLIFFLVLAALVVDIGNGDQTARSLQNAADAGALAATQQYNNPNIPRANFASDYAMDTLGQPHNVSNGCPSAPTGEMPAGSTCYSYSSNGAVNGVVYVTPTSGLAPFGGACSGSSCAKEISVKVCQTINTTFARVIHITSLRACKTATGVLGTITAPMSLFAGTACGGQGFVWNSSDDSVAGVVWSNGSFTMNGSNNTLGPTFYNSSCSPGYTLGRGAVNNTYDRQSTPTPVAPIADPCGSGVQQCDTSIYPAHCTDNITNAPATVIANHVYCINSNGNINIGLPDGFNAGVTFIVTGGAKLNFTCGGTCNVSPAATGGGFIAWNQSSGNCQNTLINANQNNPGKSFIMNGTFYAPAGGVNLLLGTTGTSSAFVDSCTMSINADINANGPTIQIPSTTSQLIR